MTEGDKPRILVVDDDLSVCKSCEKILIRDGCQVKSVLSGKSALSLLEEETFDLVFTDLKMAQMGGMELLQSLHELFPDVVPVVITGYATIASVVETMKLGAFDYLPKPFTPDEMLAVMRNAWEKRKRILEMRSLAAGEAPEGFATIIGRSPKMKEVFGLIRKVAPTSSTVLIVGESGTGKELVARAIHDLSPRKQQRFFAVDCGALSVNLLESELFGHMRGSFTGAVANKRGIFESADHGTVFLDEICNVDLEVQGKLLRFIQERDLLPVGSTEPRRVDVRLIFATNRDLSRMVTEGTFREDLYYRLHVFPICLPPLRDRREDIPLLAHHLLLKVRKNSGKSVASLSDEALRVIQQYDWPGNVRELEAAIERAVISCDGDTLEPRHLPQSLQPQGIIGEIAVPRSNEEFLKAKKVLREQAIAQLEREFALASLERNNWNVTRAAQEVGIARPNFQALMRKHGIRAGNE
ncbi:MAG TPA: sigma-54 dependent transcriptional regulator [Acidobacteriota bacterium]|nr:sigma-54 dependent transcriptional regulator [Acidobacteriota bacterium]